MNDPAPTPLTTSDLPPASFSRALLPLRVEVLLHAGGLLEGAEGEWQLGPGLRLVCTQAASVKDKREAYYLLFLNGKGDDGQFQPEAVLEGSLQRVLQLAAAAGQLHGFRTEKGYFRIMKVPSELRAYAPGAPPDDAGLYPTPVGDPPVPRAPTPGVTPLPVEDGPLPSNPFLVPFAAHARVPGEHVAVPRTPVGPAPASPVPTPEGLRTAHKNPTLEGLRVALENERPPQEEPLGPLAPIDGLEPDYHARLVRFLRQDHPLRFAVARALDLLTEKSTSLTEALAAVAGFDELQRRVERLRTGLEGVAAALAQESQENARLRTDKRLWLDEKRALLIEKLDLQKQVTALRQLLEEDPS